MKDRRKLGRIIIITVLLALLVGAMPMMAMAKGGRGHSKPDQDTRFYVPKPNRDAVRQIIGLMRDHDWENAKLIYKMVKTPQAVWFESGSPKEVKRDVARVVKKARKSRSVPILVAYNLPFRDCSQFSAGGSTTVEEYKDWIDGFARGIGGAEAIVILEPDGLGIIPWYKPFRGTSAEAGYDWCQPDEADEATAADDRFEMMNYAVEALKRKPKVTVYLDSTHSAWLNVSDASHRLIQAGVEDADGFYLNASNYQYTANSVFYGTWVSSCISMWLEADPAGSYVDCPNQYWNGGEPTGWNGTAMDSYQEWRNEPYSGDPADLAWNTVGIDWRYEGTDPTTHFVIDTSRNGLGPWDPSAAAYPDPQDWCNPPNRGLGYQPTADTGVDLVDAYLWVKLPGESDGECTRGLGEAGETPDPEWGLIDPPAGEWFPEMALQLAQNANPALD